MFYTIYRITNKINNKIYIGKHQTKDLNDSYMGSGKYLNHAIEKYGIDNFSKEILFNFDNEEEMNSKEAELVTEEFVSCKNNYNLCTGGKGGWGYINKNNLGGTLGKKHSEETKLQMSSSRKKFLLNKDYKLNTQNGLDAIKIKYPNGTFKGKTHSDETKLKMSLSSKGQGSGSKNSQFGTMWITNGIENKKIKKNESIPEGWNRGRKLIHIK